LIKLHAPEIYSITRSLPVGTLNVLPKEADRPNWVGLPGIGKGEFVTVTGSGVLTTVTFGPPCADATQAGATAALDHALSTFTIRLPRIVWTHRRKWLPIRPPQERQRRRSVRRFCCTCSRPVVAHSGGSIGKPNVRSWRKKLT
jgi:hypothetical protein